MKTYSIPQEIAPIIEQLLAITRTPYPGRDGLIKALEAQGYTVDRTPRGYRARSGSAEICLPRILCPSCRKVRGFDAFLSQKDIEHPWCVACRHADYQGAERARAERDDIWRRGETPVRANMRCGNSACPNGGLIPEKKLYYNSAFCSKACQVAVLPPRLCVDCAKLLPRGYDRKRCADCYATWLGRRAASRPCANPDCPEKEAVRPPRKYCSTSCKDAHYRAIGFYARMSAKGNERAHDIRRATGKEPNHEHKTSAISAANKAAPPRRKVERCATAYRYTVLLHPNTEGGYDAEIPGLPSVKASHRQAKKALQAIRAALRDQRIV